MWCNVMHRIATTCHVMSWHVMSCHMPLARATSSTGSLPPSALFAPASLLFGPPPSTLMASRVRLTRGRLGLSFWAEAGGDRLSRCAVGRNHSPRRRRAQAGAHAASPRALKPWGLRICAARADRQGVLCHRVAGLFCRVVATYYVIF